MIYNVKQEKTFTNIDKSIQNSKKENKIRIITSFAVQQQMDKKLLERQRELEALEQKKLFKFNKQKLMSYVNPFDELKEHKQLLESQKQLALQQKEDAQK